MNSLKITQKPKTYKLYVKAEFGWIEVISNENEVTDIHFVKKPGSNSANIPHELKKAAKELAQYFAQKRRNFSFKFSESGTAFQKSVWKAMREVPYGQTCSYLDIAKSIGNAKAVRAVGGACNKNPLPILNPCHRIVSQSGPGGFANGLKTKRALLALEGKVI